MIPPGVELRKTSFPAVNPKVFNFLNGPSVIIHPVPPEVIVSATRPNVPAEEGSAASLANFTATLFPCDPEIYTTCPFVRVVGSALYA